MNLLKKFIKKYFSSLAFFYSFLRNRILIAFLLSIAVSFLDGLGLSMFFPLLQVVGGENIQVDSAEMGNLSYLIQGIESLGISLNLISVLAVMVIFFLFKGLASYINSIYLVILRQSFVRKLRLNLLKGLNQISFKKFILTDVGRIQNTVTAEVEHISKAFNYYFQTFQQAIMLCVYIGFAFFLDAKFALLVSIGGAMTHIIYHYIYKYTKGASKKLTRFNHVYQGQVIQHVAHFKYLRASGRSRAYSKYLEGTIHNIEKSRRKIGFLASISIAAREPLMVIIIAAVIFIQVQFLGGNIGTMLISLLFFYRGLTSLVMLQTNWNSFLQVSGSMENMLDFQELLKNNREKDGKIELSQFQQSINLEKVEFHYGETQILKNINLEILKNQSVAFVGESGSGKTTLVNLISGLMPENKGEITVDGIPMKSIKKENYQSRIGYVSQDAVVFNDSLYNNISFWAEKTPENLKRFHKAIEQASLKEFLEELPGKEESLLGNNGINLSGGQKQRVSIARELFKDIDILILDEATSALDSETEKAIQENIDALRGNYTLIIIAHRLSTIRNVDKVVLMDKGEIIDSAPFEELVKKQERFRKMVELQEI